MGETGKWAWRWKRRQGLRKRCIFFSHMHQLRSDVTVLDSAPGRGERTPRGTYPPYIHFTLQKTNRDTQDALGHLARTLHVNVKDLSVAGTKDKRGVTVQRVSLKRNGKIVEDIWRLANCQNGRRSPKEAVTQRGERGVRVADLNYRKAGLELGMLKGNAFVITLRYVMKSFCSLNVLRRAR